MPRTQHDKEEVVELAIKLANLCRGRRLNIVIEALTACLAKVVLTSLDPPSTRKFTTATIATAITRIENKVSVKATFH